MCSVRPSLLISFVCSGVSDFCINLINILFHITVFQQQERIDNSRDKILREANEQAMAILQEAKNMADETIRNMNKYGQMHAPVSEMEKERAKLRNKMSDVQKKTEKKKKGYVPLFL